MTVLLSKRDLDPQATYEELSLPACAPDASLMASEGYACLAELLSRSVSPATYPLNPVAGDLVGVGVEGVDRIRFLQFLGPFGISRNHQRVRRDVDVVLDRRELSVQQR